MKPKIYKIGEKWFVYKSGYLFMGFATWKQALGYAVYNDASKLLMVKLA